MTLHAHHRLHRLRSIHPGYLVLAVSFGVLGIQALIKKGAEWSDVYVSAARLLLRGNDIYASGTAYLYPPFAAFIAIPFAPLPDWAIRAVWYAINIGAMVAIAYSSWRLAGGSRLQVGAAADRREWLVVAIGAICSVLYGLNVLEHQQTDLVIGASVLVGCFIALAGNWSLGAILIGLGAAFKGPPLLFAPYLLMRRKWLAATLILAVAVGVNLLPDLVVRPEGTIWLGRWLRLFAMPTFQPDTPLGNWGSALIYNQSLAGTVQRLATTKLSADAAGFDAVARQTVIGNKVLKAIAYGILLCMLGVSVWAAWYGSRKKAEPWRRFGRPSRPNAFECAIVIVLMLMASPMSGKAHFVVLVLPSLCLARVAVFKRDPGAVAALVPAAIGALLVNKDLVGGHVSDAALWGGVATFSAVALWAGCVAILAKGADQPAGTEHLDKAPMGRQAPNRPDVAAST